MHFNIYYNYLCRDRNAMPLWVHIWQWLIGGSRTIRSGQEGGKRECEDVELHKPEKSEKEFIWRHFLVAEIDDLNITLNEAGTKCHQMMDHHRGDMSDWASYLLHWILYLKFSNNAAMRRMYHSLWLTNCSVSCPTVFVSIVTLL